MDWVGAIIERLSGQTLEEFFQKELIFPLEMTVSFFPTDEMKRNLAYMHTRREDGGLVHRDHLYWKPLMQKTGEKHHAGGHGCFGRPLDFLSQCA